MSGVLTLDDALGSDDQGSLAGSSELPGREPIGRGHLLWALVTCTLVWIPLFVLRVQAHQANVDDFLYAQISRTISDHHNVIRSFLHTGQTAPVVPTLAAVGAHTAGLYGAMVVQLPILLLAVAGAFVLARTWMSSTASMVTALAVGLNVETLGYAVMLHFAVACMAGVLWVFAAYLRSGRFRTWGWSIVFGVAVAALLLSRSVAPIYVAPAAIAIAVDLVLDLRANGMRSFVPPVVALGVIVVLAAPWWLISGPSALHYLVSAGYQSSGGYISQGGARFNPSAMVSRVKSELSEVGWGESWALGVAVVVALVTAVSRWSEIRRMRLGLLVTFVILSVLILMTSANPSTALGLPILAVSIEACAVPISLLSSYWLRAVVPAVLGVLVVGAAFQAGTKLNVWWPPPPYRNAIIEAGGSSRTNSDLITAQVAQYVGSKPTLVLKGDPILNANGLAWNLDHRSHLIIPPLGSSETSYAIAHLREADAIVTGGAPISFYIGLDQTKVEEAAVRSGFTVVKVWKVSPSNNVLVWERLPKGSTVAPVYPPPTTTVVFPAAGGHVPTFSSGSSLFAARASDPVGILSVGFVVSGSGIPAPEVLKAKATLFGWIGAWNTSGIPAGSYSIYSVATSVDGEITRSASVQFTIGG